MQTFPSNNALQFEILANSLFMHVVLSLWHFGETIIRLKEWARWRSWSVMNNIRWLKLLSYCNASIFLTSDSVRLFLWTLSYGFFQLACDWLVTAWWSSVVSYKLLAGQMAANWLLADSLCSHQLLSDYVASYLLLPGCCGCRLAPRTLIGLFFCWGIVLVVQKSESDPGK